MCTPSSFQPTSLSRRTFLGIASAAAANAALGPAASCAPRHAPEKAPVAMFAPCAYAAQQRSSHDTLERVLGATRCVVDELEAHRNDTFYLNTSFGNTGPNGAWGDIGTWDCWYPNGRPKSNGQAYMNCAGFVVAALEACGADCDQIGNYVGSAGYNRGNKSNLYRWIMYLTDHARLCRRYESKNDLLSSGELRKGDLIIADPRDWSVPGVDCHVLFFWGDNSGHDLAWHSSNHAEGVVAGTCPGNMISKISAKSSDVYWLHVPLTNVVKLIFEKRSAALSVANGHEGAPFYSLEGAQFSIFERCVNGACEGLIAQFTTDSNGRAEVELQPNANVWVREDRPPAGFCSWAAPQRIQVGQAETTETLLDEPQTVRIEVTKIDAETRGEALGHATLEDALFEAVDSKGNSYTAKTKRMEGGAYRATFPEMARGAIRIREAAAPKGYELATLPNADSDGWLSLEAAPNDGVRCATVMVQAADRVMRGDIEGVKVYEPELKDDTFVQPALQGAKFAIWLQDDGTLAAKGYDVSDILDAHGNAIKQHDEQALRGTLIGTVESDRDGRFTSKDLLAHWSSHEHGEQPKPEHVLPFGTYTVVETSCPDPALRLMNPITNIEIHRTGHVVFLAIEDKRIASPVRVRKTDSKTGNTVLAPGTCIELLRRDAAGDYRVVEFALRTPESHTISRFTVPESGIVQFPEKLVWGSYAIREVETVAPYIVRKGIVPFDVGKNHDWDESDVMEIDLPNEQAHGKIEGRKLDADTQQGVAAATYEVRAARDIASPDGTIWLREGELAGSATTDEEGRWFIADLPLGGGTAEYIVREVQSPDGYMAELEERRITLSWKDDQTALVVAEVAIEEKPTKVVLRKSDAANGAPIEGVEFMLAALDQEDSAKSQEELGENDPIGAESDEIEPETLPEPIIVTTDEHGLAEVSHLVRGYEYEIQETRARGDLGYVTCTQVEKRYLADDGRWYESEEAWRASESDAKGDEVWNVEIENDFTRLKFFKVDAESYAGAKAAQSETGASELAAASAYLSGGLFRMEDSNGTAVQPADGTLSADGWPAQGATPVEFNHLQIGETYRIIEINAPDGYSADEQHIEVRIGNSAKPIIAIMKNHRNTTMAKTNDAGPFIATTAAGAMFIGGAAALAAYTKRRREAERTRTAQDRTARLTL